MHRRLQHSDSQESTAVLFRTFRSRQPRRGESSAEYKWPQYFLRTFTLECTRRFSHSSEKVEHEPTRRNLRQCIHVLSIIVLMLSLFAAPAAAGEINACKYLVVTDFTSDPYGIAKELRAQAAVKGFVVVSVIADVSQADLLKTCVMSGSWSS